MKKQEVLDILDRLEKEFMKKSKELDIKADDDKKKVSDKLDYLSQSRAYMDCSLTILEERIKLI